MAYRPYTNDSSDSEIAARVGNYDTGYCNPRKLQEERRLREEAIQILTSRGHTQQSAEQLIVDSQK